MRDIKILNPADSTRHYSVVIGIGGIVDSDIVVTDIKAFPIGTQLTDIDGKGYYVRVSDDMTSSDYMLVGEEGTPYFSNDFSDDFAK